MAAPNIRNPTTITGKTVGAAITTTPAAALTNAAASGQVYKVNTATVANIDGTNSVDVTVNFVDASPSLTTALISTVAVAADTALVVISKDTFIYLEEGDSITVSASANSDAVITLSYEIIS
jgi:hypothetical protein